MAYEKCPKCGFMHYATDPCRPLIAKVKKITRAEAEEIWPSKGEVIGKDEPLTIYGSIKGKPTAVRTWVAERLSLTPPALTEPKIIEIKPRGRPRTGFDKKAYDRKTAAERRRAKKEAK